MSLFKNGSVMLTKFYEGRTSLLRSTVLREQFFILE